MAPSSFALRLAPSTGIKLFPCPTATAHKHRITDNTFITKSVFLIRLIRGLFKEFFQELQHFRILAPAQPTDRALATLHRRLRAARDLDHLANHALVFHS